jgi:hypothetical protein
VSEISPATRHEYDAASKRVIGLMPLRPLITASHNESRPIPVGETIPIPVMTTRRTFAAPHLEPQVSGYEILHHFRAASPETQHARISISTGDPILFKKS